MVKQSTIDKVSWFTNPVILLGFMALSWWCISQGYDPELWFPLLSVGNFFVMMALEQLLPRNQSHNLFKDPQSPNDIAYNIMIGLLRPLLSSLIVLSIVWLSESNWTNGLQNLWPTQAPILLQIVYVLLISTFMDYWLHRTFHRYDALWWFHSVHHIPAQMHIFKGGRLHFFEDGINSFFTAFALFLLGAPQEMILMSGAWSVYAGGIVHANIAQSFPSWAHYFWPTIQLHNLHHSVERKYQDSNYSGDNPLWDWIFGTLSHPDKCPLGALGIKEDYVPKSFIQQLWFPFKAIKHPPQITNEENPSQRPLN